MKKYMIFAILLATALCAVSKASAECRCPLRAHDGTFLGCLSHEVNADSVLNQYGSYGNSYGSASIFNKFGKYGSASSMESPFNPYGYGVSIYINGSFSGFLKIGGTLEPNISAMRSFASIHGCLF